MKKFYTINASFMNGTVTMCNDISHYTDEKLAEKVAKKIEEINAESIFKPWIKITETVLYESEEEVPILNKNEK